MSFQINKYRDQHLLVVAIDGPSGSGKSTVAKRVAKLLALPHVDTGAMYRALTLKALRTGTDVNDGIALVAMVDNTAVEFTADGRTLLDGEDVSKAIRTPEVTANVSPVSAHPAVRERMVKIQRTAGKEGAVLEGRDTGTVVFPDARLKVFLLADEKVRAERRQIDLRKQGIEKNVEEVILELRRRDKYDSERDASPLRCARDAKKLDSTGLSIEQVVEKIVGWARERGFTEAWTTI